MVISEEKFQALCSILIEKGITASIGCDPLDTGEFIGMVSVLMLLYSDDRAEQLAFYDEIKMAVELGALERILTNG